MNLNSVFSYFYVLLPASVAGRRSSKGQLLYLAWLKSSTWSFLLKSVRSNGFPFNPFVSLQKHRLKHGRTLGQTIFSYHLNRCSRGSKVGGGVGLSRTPQSGISGWDFRPNQPSFHSSGVGDLAPESLENDKTVKQISQSPKGQLRIQVASATSRRSRVSAVSQKGLISISVYPYTQTTLAEPMSCFSCKCFKMLEGFHDTPLGDPQTQIAIQVSEPEAVSDAESC